MVFDKFCEHEFASEGHGEDRETIVVSNFPYDEIFRRLDGEPEEGKSTAAISGEALIALLSWIVGDRPSEVDSPFGIAARAIALLWMLRPDLVPGFRTISDVATHTAMSKQALSKSLAEFKREARWTHAKHFKLAPPGCYQESGKRGWKTRLANLQKRKESAAAQALSGAAIAK